MTIRLFPVVTVLSLCGGLALAADRAPHGTSAQALKVARESLTRCSLGRLAVRQKGDRPERVRAELLFGGTVVARLRVDPRSGVFLAKDERPGATGEMLDAPALRAAAERSLQTLEIGEWAWPAEHGRAWGVPLRSRGRVVGKIAVDVEKGFLPVKDDDD